MQFYVGRPLLFRSSMFLHSYLKIILPLSILYIHYYFTALCTTPYSTQTHLSPKKQSRTDLPFTSPNFDTLNATNHIQPID